MTDSPQTSRPQPGLFQSLIPVFFLILMLWGSFMLFGDESSSGPNQIALILAASVGILLGIFNCYSWTELQDGIVKGIGLSMGAILILLAVGALIGTWIMAGIVPTMIYYGLQILHPSIFFLASCIICSVVSLATGSSWTTAGTIGVALIGIAGALDLSLAIAAGAIISGAYFGDKLSPLSDTTNLAPAMVGTDLFTHIRHMMWTTFPSMTIALLLFGIIGFAQTASGRSADLGAVLAALETSFNLGWHLLIPPLIVVFLAVKRMPAFPAILLGALIGGLFAAVFQTQVVVTYAAADGLPTWAALIKGVWKSLFG
ncbi:MAG: Na+/H+ antiporter NhaC family protein, partial [Acidobacteriota bacterium]